MLQKKICMIGSFAVGKTSLVSRYVRSIFSESYLTTVGVKIDEKRVSHAGQEVKLVLWDVHGEDELQKIRRSYLRGAAGCFLVADGTRPATLDAALELSQMMTEVAGEVPRLLLVNKHDLRDEWMISSERIGELEAAGWRVRTTSAKSGAGVEEAFAELTALLVGDHEHPRAKD